MYAQRFYKAKEETRVWTPNGLKRNNARVETKQAKEKYKGELSSGAHDLMTDV